MDWKAQYKFGYDKLTKDKKKPTTLDWIVSSILFSLAGLIVVFGVFLKPETKQECVRRVGKEIIARKKASGETTVKDRAEIEAYGEEFKRKCNVIF